MAMSSAASLLMLLLEMLNIERFEIFCKPCAIFMAPTDCKLFSLRYRLYLSENNLQSYSSCSLGL